MKRLVIAFAGITTLVLAVEADAGPRPKRRAAQLVKKHTLDRKPDRIRSANRVVT